MQIQDVLLVVLVLHGEMLQVVTLILHIQLHLFLMEVRVVLRRVHVHLEHSLELMHIPLVLQILVQVVLVLHGEQ